LEREPALKDLDGDEVHQLLFFGLWVLFRFSTSFGMKTAQHSLISSKKAVTHYTSPPL